MIEVQGKYSTAKVMIDNVEESCMSQIYGFVNHFAFSNPIAIMPDTHAGKGSVIGFTMEMTDKVIPNVVGVDIGCFTKDTKVKLADSRELTFKELIEEDMNGKTNFCFSKDENDNVVIEKIIYPRKTRSTTKLIEITLDNDQKITCTTDHIFYDNSKDVKACDLKINQSLYPLYIEKSSDVSDKLSKRNKRYKLADYLTVYNPKTKLYDYMHVLADDFNIRHNVYTQSKSIRHHNDFNKYNNNPTNIIRMKWDEHFKLHASHAKEHNIAGHSGWGKTWEKNKERFSKMSSEKMKKLHQQPDFQKRLKIRAKENRQKYLQSSAFYKMTRDAGERGKKYLINYAKSDKGRNKSSEIGKEQTSRQYECPICNKIIKSARACPKHFKQKNHANYNLSMKDMILLKNHKVKSIKIINCKQTDVYCLTTKYENFALAAGVFVHNCGMLSMNIGQSLPISLEELDRKIRNAVPFGKSVHDEAIINMKTEFPWHETRVFAEKFLLMYSEKFNKRYNCPKYDIDWFFSKCEKIGGGARRIINSLGTLGGGNHFIETGIAENGDHWITIHTGSRNFGKKICENWQRKAIHILRNEKSDKLKEAVERIRQEFSGQQIKDEIDKVRHNLKLDMKINLNGQEWLEEDNAVGYLLDMIFAQKYAEVNRKYIGQLVKKILKIDIQDEIETTHNFIDFRDCIIRKGAIRSYENERMIIPFNMRDGILLCEGKSNPEWNYSAPHGAGRIMSRSGAKRELNMEDFKKQMEGIYSTSICKATLDEAPGAYKDASIIEEAIEQTAKIITKIKPIHNMKDSEEFSYRKNRKNRK